MRSKTNILVLTYWEYQDALIQTYTLPYLRIIASHLPPGSSIFLLTLDKQARPEKTTIEPGIINISLPYVPFGGKAAYAWLKYLLILRGVIKKENISFLHSWCTPAGMIGYILSVACRKQLIVDSYEPHAEAMAENGEWKRSGTAFRLLLFFEKRQTRRAKYLIACTERMKEYSRKKYGHTKNNILVKPACVDAADFVEDKAGAERLRNELGLQDKIVGLYSGKFGGIYLEQEIFDFFKVCHEYWGENFRILLLSNASPDLIRKLLQKANLPEHIVVHRFIPHAMIPSHLQVASFALTPVKPVPSKEYCSPIKDGEYWASGLPVVITKNISEDSDIIARYNIGSILEELNPDAYKRSVEKIDELLKSNHNGDLSKKIKGVAARYRNYAIAHSVYEQIYASQK